MNFQELDPSVEVVHLRRLLDTQPGCLMRIAADGTVLAANDAALSLLGAASRAQVLGRDFAGWIPEDQRDGWIAFTIGVTQGSAAASTECEITAASGERRASLLNAVPLLDHPDGVASMAVAIRGLSHQRQVEATIVELEEQLRDRDADWVAARERLEEVEGYRRQLAETLALVEAGAREREQAAREQHDAQQARLHEFEATRERLEARLDESEAARRRSEAEREDLQARLDESEAARRKSEAEREDLQARLDESEAARRKSEAERKDLQACLDDAAEGARRQREAEREDLEARLQEAEAARGQGKAERDALQARLDEARKTCDLREAERDAQQGRVVEVLAVLQRRDAELQQLQAAHTALAAAHEGLSSDHDRLLTALREQAIQLGALVGGLSPAAGSRHPQPALASTADSREEDRA